MYSIIGLRTTTTKLVINRVVGSTTTRHYTSNNSNNSTEGRQQNEEVEKDWFKPNDRLIKYHHDITTTRKQPHVVYLEGPSGSGKAQLLERIDKLGYQTLCTPFLSFSLDHNGADVSTSITSLQSSWDQLIEQRITEIIKSKQQLKNDMLFVHRSPISSVIYSALMRGDDRLIKATTMLVDGLSAERGNSIIYCKTPIELIEQRVEGRYHFYDDNQKAIVDRLHSKQYLQKSVEMYNALESHSNVIRATLDTTSIKQACPGLLALFNIYFTPSASFQTLLNNRLKEKK
ncbi:hypothetical protein SAMD00019534_075000 [Acytostelium subglobosum LB1]|uniref:hypothetical protein n=1 Tax=Acytostelium subglobosum LB1 TaxID=1410327 RepID=UPI000644F0F5|nr:hypothetical protein SAMD00019534_075000 [Acytostelium subglobosum LB1]GAM24325.1 hypothetical protein SAMD00019534_075000 [Acytostelium subglobosum LB1]|eukprot:XP_012752651.1 hypothetical protein SAMD00019534_075000 [Acytostelium subglobosum LB1]